MGILGAASFQAILGLSWSWMDAELHCWRWHHKLKFDAQIEKLVVFASELAVLVTYALRRIGPTGSCKAAGQDGP